MNTLPFTVEKNKLPKGHSYVLKTSLLAGALDQAGITCHLHLIYWMPKPEGSLLQVHYWMPNPRVDYRRVYVRAGSLPNQQRSTAAELLRIQAIPLFISWRGHLMALPDTSPLLYQEPFYEAVYTGGVLQISITPQPS